MITQYRGTLKMEPELKTSQLKHLTKYLGQDIRQHSDWEKNEFYHKLHYTIDLEMTPDFENLRWTGAKSGEMVAQINYLRSQMIKVCPDFKLSGSFTVNCQDEKEKGDIIIGEDGWAVKVTKAPSGTKIQCPLCKGEFYHNGTKED